MFRGNESIYLSHLLRRLHYLIRKVEKQLSILLYVQYYFGLKYNLSRHNIEKFDVKVIRRTIVIYYITTKTRKIFMFNIKYILKIFNL